MREEQADRIAELITAENGSAAWFTNCRGALLVVSHDYPFLNRIGIDTVIELEPDGRIQRRGAL